MRRTWRNGRPHLPRRGASATEMALILPAIMLLVIGCVDLGRFAYHYIAVGNAARAGAGYGIMNNFNTSTQTTWTGKIQQAAIDEMTGQTSFQSNQLSVSVNTADDLGNGDLRVQVSASYPFSTIVTWPGIPRPMTLTRTVSMRHIRR
jgi:Flp pilus assembly protein TadG